MTKHPRRVEPRFDALETRLALSAATLTIAEYDAAVRHIHAAVARQVATGNVATGELAKAAAAIPNDAGLLSTLKAVAAAHDGTTKAKAKDEIRSLSAALNQEIRAEEASGALIIKNKALAKSVARAYLASFPATINFTASRTIGGQPTLVFTQMVNGTNTFLGSVAFFNATIVRGQAIIPQSQNPIVASVNGYRNTISITSNFTSIKVIPYNGDVGFIYN